MFWLVLSAMVVLLASGTAVAYALGASSVLAFIASDNLRYLAIMPQRIFSQIDVFSLMAMPLFILAGEIMNRAGITRALVDFAMAMLGRLKGGLGHVNVLASVFFAGISGSAVADAAALGNTLVPAMVARGYPPLYASALTAAASVIGPIIPPSIVMIFYGAVMQTSVAALFVAGVVPGLMLGGVLFAANAWFARRHNHPGGRAEDVPPFWPALGRALPALSLPLIIMGGIVFGIVTPTEAAALTVVAALAVGAWYGGLGRAALSESLVQTAALTGAIFMILGAVACFGWLAGHEQLPTRLAAFVTEMGLGRVEYLIVINLIFIAAGMLLDPPVALALLVPLLAPPAVALGVDPVHLGIVLCLNLTIGLITPPVGGCLLTVSTVCKVEYWALARAILPFAVLEVLLLLVLVLVPEFSLFLPRWFGLLK
jgi:tripartite ATP-independent transporter DctM subunit